MGCRKAIMLSVLAAFCAVSSGAMHGSEADQVEFAISTKYARPYNDIETQNARKWLLGPTGIFAYGPYGPSWYLHHFRDYEQDRNWFVVLSLIPDSPAVGHIFPDDVITGANGKAFPKGEDARVHMGRAIIDSEAADGVLKLSVNRKGKPIEVEIQLTPIGGHSATWPFNCPRTERMVTDACRFLQEEQLPSGYIPADEARIGTSHGGLLLLGTGEPQYLENARRAAYWFADLVTGLEEQGERLSWGAWSGSYAAILMAEYYQMTGDRGILPALEISAAQIARGQMPSGGWGHGYFNGFEAGYGEMNNCGITCYMALVMAKECGVKVDEVALRKAKWYFDAFAPAVASQYGDHGLILQGYRAHNGHIGQLAVAHRLQGNTEYADAYALKAARSADRIEDGHTGCFMNIIWTPIASSFSPAVDYRRRMDQLDWYYAMSRQPRGGLYCQPGGDNLQRTGGEYSVVGENMSTGGFALALIAPRRHLRILGATPSVFVVDLPPALAAARELHQKHQWDACIAAVDAFLENNKAGDVRTLRLANELRDKARYVKTSVNATLDQMEAMFAVKNPRLNLRAYEIKQMLQPMKMLLGEDDPRLLALEERLPYEDKGVFKKGEEYYAAAKTLKVLRMELWWPYGHFAQQNSRWMVVVPRDDWTAIYDSSKTEAKPRYAALEEGQEPPAGWQTLEFDAAGWTERLPGGRKGQYAVALMRMPFELKANDVFGLRLSMPSKPSFETGAKVYLNGELVLKCNSRLHGKARLLTATTALLKKGKNVLAIEFPHMKRLPEVALEARMMAEESAFAWTPVPGRDEALLALTSRRLDFHRRYYDPEADERTPEELLAALNQTPSFMPELYYAWQRFETVVPAERRAEYLQAMLDSPVWGSRFVGLLLLSKGVVEPEKGRRMSQEEFEQTVETFKKLRQTYDPFRSRAEALLSDPHFLVRMMAARCVGGYADASKETVPTLIQILENNEEQHWWVREAAYLALNRMTLDPEVKQSYTVTALQDPSAAVRRHPLGETARLKDPEERLKAMQAYQNAMIEQVFDAPLGMYTNKTRSSIAPKLKAFGKEALRPYLPRFVETLKDETGPRLEGASGILAWFGPEVIDTIEALLGEDNEFLRANAIKVLVLMATGDEATPELRRRIIMKLKASARDEATAVSRAALEGLKVIEKAEAKE